MAMGALAAWLAVAAVATAGQQTTSSRPCTDADWHFGFSECGEAGNSQTRGVFAYAPEQVCNWRHAESRPLPEPILGVPCDVPCEEGGRLAVSLKAATEATKAASLQVGCQPCEAGRFSLGGGFLIDGAAGEWANPWPAGLRTFCFYKGSDYQWYPGSGQALLCVLRLGDLVAETRAGTWNAQLPDSSLQLPLVAVPGDGLGCENLLALPQAAALRGAAALVLRGRCSFQAKSENLAAAGVRAVVLYNNEANAGYFIPAAVNASAPPRIPIFMITREDGLRWKSALDAAQGGQLNFRVGSTRCSMSAREAVPASGSPQQATNNSAPSLEEESWDDGHHGCTPWAADRTGRFLHSGNNLHFHWIYSVLTLSVRFVRDGHLRFRYSVDSEVPYDGLSFQMDEAELMPRPERKPPYAEFRVEVPRGPHTFTWYYTKDFSTSEGEDRARIQLLEVVGTSYSDNVCLSCVGPGAAAGTGGRCARCGADQYLDVQVASPESSDPSALARNASTCQQCPTGSWAVPGSVGLDGCRPRRPCEQRDIERTYVAFEMNSGTRRELPGEVCRRDQTLSRTQWRQPLTCDPTLPGSVQLPEPKEAVVQCPPCQAHQRRPTGDRCLPVMGSCPQGSYALRELVISHWEVWPQNVSSEVWGPSGALSPAADAYGRGWQLEMDGEAAVVGTAFSGGAGAELAGKAGAAPEALVDVALLHLSVALDEPGDLLFYLEVQPASAWGLAAVVTVNETTPELTVFDGTADVVGAVGQMGVAVSLPVGVSRVTWSWHYDADKESTDAADEKPGGMRLLNVSVTHAVGAGSSRCERCAPGRQAEANSLICSACPAGRSTVEGAEGCSLCPAGRYAPPGTAECLRCGPGLASEAGAQRCEPAPLVASEAAPSAGSQRQFSASALAAAWSEGGDTSKGTLRHVKVEDRHFYLSLFEPHAAPQGMAGGSGGVVDGSTVAYWWEELPPLSEDEVDEEDTDVCGGATFRTVGETLEGMEAAVDGQTPGIWATFSGYCDDGVGVRPRLARILFKCDPSDLSRFKGVGTFANVASAISSSATGWEVLDLGFSSGGKPKSARSCEDITIEWHTGAACPLCHSGDYVPIASGPCHTEKGQKIEHVLAFPCSGGAEPPGDYWVPCGGAGGGVVAAIIVALTLLSVCCIGCYVFLLRRRYAKYMMLEDEVTTSPPAAGGTTIGVASWP